MSRRSPCEDHWTEIRRRLDLQQTRRQIADALGLSFPVVQAFLQRRKIPGRPHTHPLKVDEIRLRQLLDAGHTHGSIATRLGVSHSAIERRVWNLDLQSARTGPRHAQGHPEWIDGRRLSRKDGYVWIFVPLHPHASRGSSSVFEHRLLMEVLLGRYLTLEEVVHHRDEYPAHNWPENLRLYASNADHLRDELSDRVKASPRRSRGDVPVCSQQIARCPTSDETLARCSSETRAALDWYIESHHPTSAHRTLPRRAFLRSGAWRDPFRPASTD